ncbi:hypothetical protein GCM10029963_25250 [Micromonospora andamanensis]
MVLGATATAGGVIGLLTTMEPRCARGFVQGPNGNSLPYYEPVRPCSSALLRFEAGAWSRTGLDHLPVSYPMLALLPGGEALVVCPRRPWTGEGWNPHNAHVFAADGAHVRTLILGDNIVGLTVDDEGGIWTAHGEEGWKSVGAPVSCGGPLVEPGCGVPASRATRELSTPPGAPHGRFRGRPS